MVRPAMVRLDAALGRTDGLIVEMHAALGIVQRPPSASKHGSKHGGSKPGSKLGRLEAALTRNDELITQLRAAFGSELS